MKRLEIHWQIKDHHISFGIDAPVEAELVVNGKPISQYTDEEVEEIRQDYFDSWCWETGSEEEKTIYESLCEKLQRRKTLALEREIVDSLSKSITEEIDAEILSGIRLNFGLDEDKSDD